MAKSIEEWGREVYANSQNPHVLSKINVQLAGYYAYLTGQYIQSKFKYAAFYDEWKHDDEGKKRSDKWIDAMWLMTDDGKQYYTLKKEIKAYELMMSAIKTATIVANQEMKNNQYQ